MLIWDTDYEGNARERKADTLATFLRQYWGSQAGELASRMNDEQWKQVAICARVRKPGRITRIMVLTRLGVPRKACRHAAFVLPAAWFAE